MTMQTMLMPTTSATARALGFAGTVASRLVNFVRAYKNRRDIQLLAGFDDYMLRDIGLTRGDLRDAAAEPLWRDPTSILVTRVRERRGRHQPQPSGLSPQLHDAPPLAPVIDDWSSRLFPARSRYY